MRSRNSYQLGLVLLILGSLAIALLAGYGIAALATGKLGRSAAPDTSERPRAVLGETDEQPTASEPPSNAQALESAAPSTEATAEAAGDELLRDSFDTPASGWLEQETPTWRAGYAEGQYQLALSGQRTIGVSAPLPAERYRLSADVSVSAGAGGLIFLAVGTDVYYRFMLDENGLYTIELQRQDQLTATPIIDWTASQLLTGEPGTTHRVRIERGGTTIRVWIDDEPLMSWAVPAGDVRSQYGFAVSSAQGRAAASFDNLVAEELQEAVTPTE